MAVHELPEMPNAPLLELHGQRKRFHVPYGLKEMLEDATREVLRYQPDDIYGFLAKYLELKLEFRNYEEEKRQAKLLRAYDGEGPDLLKAAELDDFLIDLNVTKAEADKAATKIQAVFRGHQARRSLTNSGKVIHQDHRKSWEWKRWSWEGKSELNPCQLEEFLGDLHVDYEQADKAATKIQAVFRGHKVRTGGVLDEKRKLRKSHEWGGEGIPPPDYMGLHLQDNYYEEEDEFEMNRLEGSPDAPGEKEQASSDPQGEEGAKRKSVVATRKSVAATDITSTASEAQLMTEEKKNPPIPPDPSLASEEEEGPDLTESEAEETEEGAT